MPHMKYIGVITIGVEELADGTPDLLDKLLRAIAEEVHRVDGWFREIEVEAHRFFAAGNGEDGYTMMLPEEYWVFIPPISYGGRG